MARKPKNPLKKPKITVPPSRDVPVTFETVRTQAVLDEIREYAKEGCTLEQIAGRLMVTRSTLYQWTKKYPEVNDVIREGNKVADDRVEESLYEMCFPHEEREITVEKDPVTNQVVKQIIRTKYVPANFQAIQYWLQNRRRDEWKSHQSLEFHGSGSALPVQIVYDLDTKEKPDIDSPDKSE